MVAFPEGTAAGSTGEIGVAIVTGTTTSAAYTMDLPEDTGNGYMFAWNDSDPSTDPTIPPEDFGCALFTVAAADLTGIDITLDSSGTNCTLGP